MVNAYTTKDQILKLFSLSQLEKSIGRNVLDVEGVDNIDVS